MDFEGANFDGGFASLTINAKTNTVYNISGGGEEVSESRVVDGQTCWLVTVGALPAGKRSAVVGLDSKFVRGMVLADYTGKAYIYLPDGEYDFTVAGFRYHASVSGAATKATYEVGIYVDGVDISAESGEGWSYNGTLETLTLENAREYGLSGTNTDRRVTVCVKAAGTKVRADRLVLAAASRGAFVLDGSSASLQLTGGTLTTGEIESPLVVSGGSIDAELVSPSAPSGNAVYRLVVGGFTRYGQIEIESIEGLEGYDLSGIYANDMGEAHLWVPDGEYFFNVIDGASTNTMIAAVHGESAVALNYEETGVIINGRDAGRLSGTGWINNDGLVTLNSAAKYVITGTNYGARISIRATESLSEITLRGLVMTNSLESAAPLALAATLPARYTVVVEGTNILHGTGEWNCGLELGERATVEVGGSGRLEVRGADAPGIGLERAGVSKATLIVNSGEIVATGGEYSAGIGGGGQDGFRVEVNGGSVRATGGINGAGIGGGSNSNAGYYMQTAGTVVAKGANGGADIGSGSGGGKGSGQRMSITGGSLKATRASITIEPVNDNWELVYRVTIPVGIPNLDVGAVMPDYNGYSLVDAKTDEDGNIYVWLPDGTYYVNMGGKPYRAVVDGDDVVAEVWTVGVFIDGEDLALQSGEGWTYDIETGVASVSGSGLTISGTNTAGTARIEIANDASVVVSNLVLSAHPDWSPFSIADGASAVVAIAGDSVFESAAAGMPGIEVPYGATLVITNIDSTVSVPDLDNINTTTNTLYDIVELDDGTIVTNDIIEVVIVSTNYYDTVVSPTLRAVGAENAAGIGGGRAQSHGTVEIIGGAITATGGKCGAGIGSGYFSDSGDGAGDAETLRQGTIRIGGGEVAATGGEKAAGIGGGNQHSGGVIEISGGKVVAKGGRMAAGIGGGYSARGHTVSISGGEVVATGGENGAGIGGAISGPAYMSSANTEPCRIAISGGRVAATGGEGASGIGSGYLDSQHAAVDISGGTVVATGGAGMDGYSTPDDIGIGSCGSSVPVVCPLSIRGASVHAVHRTAAAEHVAPAPSNGTERVYCVTIGTAFTNAQVKVDYLDDYAGHSEIYTDADGKIYLWLPDGRRIFSIGGDMFSASVSGADVAAEPWFTGVLVDGVDVSHMETRGKKWGYDLSTRTLAIQDDCVVSGTNKNNYVHIVAAPKGELSFTISNLYLKVTSGSPVKIEGGVNTLRLAGVNTLDASATDDYAALNVDASATLAITNLEENAALVAKGGADGAGIGGNRSGGTGTIRIEGGLISAYGLDDGAGIGSGYKGTCGDIYITGGRVTATGGTSTELFSSYCGAGIGGGDSSDSTGCRIEISGGTVVAYSKMETPKKYAALIGDGYSSKANNGYSISITGGSVTSRGRSNRDAYFTASDADAPNIPVNAAGDRVYCVMVEGLEPGAAIAFDGLPEYYGTSGIYADGGGRVYLWLPEDWSGSGTPGGAHPFSANGYRYTAWIDSATGSARSERGEALALEELRIEDIVVGDGWVQLEVSALPATWLQGFGDTLVVRASRTLPIPDDATLYIPEVVLRLEDGTRAVLVVPLDEKFDSMFFSIVAN